MTDRPLPTVEETVDFDLSKKCSSDVAAAMCRNITLADSQRGCVVIAVSGAATAMAWMTGTFWASQGRPLDEGALDALWVELIRPLAMKSIDKGNDLKRTMVEVAAKRVRP